MLKKKENVIYLLVLSINDMSKINLSKGINTNQSLDICWPQKNTQKSEMISDILNNLPNDITYLILSYDYEFECLLDYCIPKNGILNATYFLPNSKMIQCLDEIYMIDLGIKRSVTKIKTCEKIFRACSFSFMPNCYCCYITESRSSIRVCKIDPNKSLVLEEFLLGEHQDQIIDIEVLSDGRVITCSKNEIKIWDPIQKESVKVITVNEQIKRIDVFGEIFVTRSGKKIRVWDSNTYECKAIFEHFTRIFPVGLCVRNKLVCESDYNEILILDIESKKCIKTIQASTYNYNTRMIRTHIHPSGKIICIENERLIKIIDLEELLSTEHYNVIFLDGHQDTINVIKSLPDGRIVSAGKDHTIRVWENDNHSHRIIHLEEDDEIDFLKITPDGRLIGYLLDNRMKIWK